MKRIYRVALFVLFTLASFSTLQAKVVDRDEALKVATDFFRTHNMAIFATSNVREVWNSSQLAQTRVTTLSATQNPTFYVFAPETGKGFVVVSADDRTLPILGYSLDKEILIGDDMPCNFLWWCEAMDRQVSLLCEADAESVKKTCDNGISTLATDELLLETAEWNQNSPYNNDCPLDGSSRSMTGCVSTAFAIAMRYHQYPECGKGQTEAYTTSTKSIYVDSRDLSSHYYDWGNMPLKYEGSYTTQQADAVALLMADIGTMLQADYASGETATVVGTPTSSEFYKYFGYSSSGYLAQADTYTDDEWTALLKKEIASNGPVSYTSALLVHQFVLDGYQSDSYFHINWGWGGYDNGYFLLPDIVEGQDTQLAFMDFIPDDGKQLTTLQVCEYNGAIGLNTTNEIFTQGESFVMGEAYFLNVGAATFSGVVAYGLTDSEGNLKEVISSNYGASGLPPYYMTGITSATCTITSTIEDGDCIRYIYKDTNASNWRCMEPYESGLVYKIIITEDMIGQPEEHQYSLLMYTPGLSVSIDEFYELGCSFTADAYPVNVSGETITTYLRFALTDGNGNVKEWISNYILLNEIPSGSYGNINGVSCTIANGVEVGDFIRLFYQGIYNDEDTWKTIDSYYGSACPIEVEVTNVIPTSISSVRADHSDSDVIYTLQGIRVNDMNQSGVYIKNGKKILVK